MAARPFNDSPRSRPAPAPDRSIGIRSATDRLFGSNASGEISSQSFQSVARRRHEITEHYGVVELHQFSAGDPGYVRRKPFRNTSLLENQRGERAPEASDHHPLRIMV